MVDTYADEPTSELTNDPATAPLDDRSEGFSARLALVVFAVYIAVAFIVILTVVGDQRWFLGDEWTLLADRDSSDLGDYFRSVNGHLILLPTLAYRAMFALFGLHSYVPYQALVVATHLTSAVLLRVVMRRAEVGPWVATLVAATFVLLGSGEANIAWGFQITMGGTLALGLGHLILADHVGPIDRRDLLGLFLGFLGLICSAVVVTMVVAVGIATLLRRGWKVAAFHTVPLGVVFAGWYLFGREPLRNIDEPVTGSELATTSFRFAWTALKAPFEAIGQSPVVGLALFVVLAVGLVLAWRPLDAGRFRAVGTLPLALIGALPVFVLTTTYASYSRGFWLGMEEARTERYVHIMVALILPALAVAVNAFVCRWRLSAPILVALLLLGVPGNVRDFGDPLFGEAFYANERAMVLGIGRTDLAERVGPAVEPDILFLPGVTVGWLRAIDVEGKLPDAVSTTSVERASWPLRLGLSYDDAAIPGDLSCEPLDAPIVLDLDEGDRFAVEAGSIIIVDRRQDATGTLGYDPAYAGSIVTAEASLLLTIVEDPSSKVDAVICT